MYSGTFYSVERTTDSYEYREVSVRNVQCFI